MGTAATRAAAPPRMRSRRAASAAGDVLPGAPEARPPASAATARRFRVHAGEEYVDHASDRLGVGPAPPAAEPMPRSVERQERGGSGNGGQRGGELVERAERVL